jgi:Fe-S cluster biogenesis protein NfuA
MSTDNQENTHPHHSGGCCSPEQQRMCHGSEAVKNSEGENVDNLKDKVQTTLDKIRPALVADGGDVELVDVKDGVVKVKLTGHCAGCPMSQMTLRNGIERLLKQEIPEVKQVVPA